jgi:hypothetical protein
MIQNWLALDIQNGCPETDPKPYGRTKWRIMNEKRAKIAIIMRGKTNLSKAKGRHTSRAKLRAVL